MPMWCGKIRRRSGAWAAARRAHGPSGPRRSSDRSRRCRGGRAARAPRRWGGSARRIEPKAAASCRNHWRQMWVVGPATYQYFGQNAAALRAVRGPRGARRSSSRPPGWRTPGSSKCPHASESLAMGATLANREALGPNPDRRARPHEEATPVLATLTAHPGDQPPATRAHVLVLRDPAERKRPVSPMWRCAIGAEFWALRTETRTVREQNSKTGQLRPRTVCVRFGSTRGGSAVTGCACGRGGGGQRGKNGSGEGGCDSHAAGSPTPPGVGRFSLRAGKEKRPTLHGHTYI